MRLRISLFILLAAVLTVADASAQARMELVPSVSFATTYDDNIFTTQEGSGDAMMLVTPAFEAFYESPTHDRSAASSRSTCSARSAIRR